MAQTAYQTADEVLRGADGTPTALVVVDMLNPYEHEDAAPLVRSVAAALPELCRLVACARERAVLTVFVNDNYGHWDAGRPEIVAQAMAGRHPDLVEPIVPEADVPFITKARHSAFYETPLEYMLRHAGIERAVLAGQVTEQCILYSALDAYVRHMQIAVPRRAVAAIHDDLAAAALRMMELNMDAVLL
jgi:nicotinamidase-related amidase